MSDFSIQSGEASGTGRNLPVYTVSEISQAIKRTLEGNFEWVQVRGEISGFKKAVSGHLYMSLKDADAVLDAVCWRGTAGRLGLVPEDGMEVIASGRVSSYPGRSRYQLIVDRLELAGDRALLKLLEERKRKLAAEGLFEEARKRPPPFLPEVIGVVTSPTGAVIRDILHRLRDRFPRRVLVWPVLVQGEGAAEQIAAAIHGFDALAPDGAVPRPDVLIVARGGGSLEDLWAFNEEVVVRAAAACGIPLISAVGHETDVTLIDFAADLRAPTPTAAGEMAVPVRADLMEQVLDAERRQRAAWQRRLEEQRIVVEGLSRGLPDPVRLLGEKSQRLDERAERFQNAITRSLARLSERVSDLGARLPHPRRQLALAHERLEAPVDRIAALGPRLIERPRDQLGQLNAERRLRQSVDHALARALDGVTTLGRVLESASYHNTLKRGFAVVHGPQGLITRAKPVTPGLTLDVEFADGRVPAVAAGDVPSDAAAVPRRARRRSAKDGPQGSLF